MKVVGEGSTFSPPLGVFSVVDWAGEICRKVWSLEYLTMGMGTHWHPPPHPKKGTITGITYNWKQNNLPPPPQQKKRKKKKEKKKELVKRI